MNLSELQFKRGKLVTAAREALAEIKASTDDGRLRELEDRHDRIMSEFDSIDEEIARAKKRPISGDSHARGVDEGDAPSYRTVFHKFISSGGDLGALEPDERAILRAGAAPDAEKRMQTTGTTAGGYTVPTELAEFIVKSMKAWGPMYDEDICTVINTTSGNPLKIPTVDDTAVTAVARTEGTALTDDGSKDVTFGQKSLDAYVYDTSFVKFSHELARDSIFNMESLLGGLLGERLGRIANSKLTVGSGSGEPHGVVTASSLGKTAAAVAAVTYDEIIDLVHSVDPAYRGSPKAAFMFNDSTLSALRKIKDGNGQYVWTAGDIQGGIPGTILGYRYHINQAMASIATGNKTVLFGDFGRYFVRRVGAPVIGVLRERFWPDLGIAGLISIDGELGDASAIRHLVQA